MSKELFSEFQGSSRTEWEESIKKILKGKPIEGLDWEASWGIKMKPFFTREDVQDNETGAPVFESGDWKTAVEIHGPDMEVVKELIEFHGQNGAEAFHLCFKGWHQVFPNGIPRENLRKVLSMKMDVEATVFGGHFVEEFLQGFLEDPIEDFKGTFALDPYFNYLKHGKWDPNIFERYGQLAEDANNHRENLAHIALSNESIHEAGASLGQEVAAVISMLVDYLDKDEFAIDTLKQNVRFYISVAGHFFPEIAKLRAIRRLLDKIGEVYEIEGLGTLPIIARTSLRTLDGGEPQNNLLRQTTECASAVLGGADVIAVRPYDLRNEYQDIKNSSLARNIPLILRDEAHLNRVADPGAGSWYIEKWTQAIMEDAWKHFLHWEGMGGFFEAMRHGYMQEELNVPRVWEDKVLSSRKKVMVGVNNYPPAKFKKELLVRDGHAGRFMNRIQVITYALPFAFKGRPIGLERKKAALLAPSKEKEPEILIFSFGDEKKARSRMAFAKNYMGCFGYPFIEPENHHDLEYVEFYLKARKPMITVMVADHEAFEQQGMEIYQRIIEAYPKSLVLMAWEPEDALPWYKAGVGGFLFEGRDMQEFFERMREVIGQTY